MLVVVDSVVVGAAIVGMVGAALDPAVPAVGDAVIVGTAGMPLTPRLLISVEPNGIPVRLTPPSAVGAVGVDEDATLFEPEPHIPDSPAVSNVPDVVDTPDVLKSPEELEIPDVDDPDIVVPPDIDPPAVPAVAGALTPIPIPPPSKLAVDPNIVVGAVPTVEHAVPLLVLGIAIVPVTPVGAGLSPPEVTSVAPSPIPVGPTAVPAPAPSGDVAPRVGVAGNVPTCAAASLQARNAASATAINANFIVTSR
jgi:hypothetical protein